MHFLSNLQVTFLYLSIFLGLGVNYSVNSQHRELGAFTTEYKDLGSDVVFDIYCVKKTHKFSFEHRAEYRLMDLLDDTESAEKDTLLGIIGLTEGVKSWRFRERINSVSLYPSWLIDDDVFDVMQWTFACTEFVNHLPNLRGTNSVNVRIRIIPQSIVSVYDQEKEWQIDGIGCIDEFLKNAGVSSYGLQSVPLSRQLGVEAKAKLIQSVFANIIWQSTPEFHDAIVMLIDRRNCYAEDMNGHETLWIFQCTDKETLDPLDRNHFIGFDFEIGKVVKAWWRFGEYQKIRFFPEYITSLIPRMFVTPDMNPMDYLMKIYDSDFKHQWRVSLDDPTFNLYCKAITGDDHISNNYHRERVSVESHVVRSLGFWEYLRRRTDQMDFDVLYRWHIGQDMDSDAVFGDLIETDDVGKPEFIDDDDSNFAQWTRRENHQDVFWSLKRSVMKWKKMECNGKKGTIRDLKDCHHFEVILRQLRAYNSSSHEVDASNLGQFNLGEIIESFDHIVIDHRLMDAEHGSEIHRFITSKLACDELTECAILSKYSNRVRERADKKGRESDVLDLIERECAVMNDVLNSVHALLLHRDQDQWRESDHRFGSEVIEINVDEALGFKQTNDMTPRAIEFGESVLRWIPFGERPYFRSLRDEIVNNKDSTIDEELFERYLIECIGKIQGTTYSLREMLALKLYADTTIFQSLLRKAHWQTSSLSVKKPYYFWALTLYEAALYHSVPIPSVNGKSPQTLFHGVNRVFTVNDEHPKYHGPFSSSTLSTVAHRFTKETGLYFRIMPSYSNPLQCCVGINMENISCFKHEREILLVEQYIPIRSTKTFMNKVSVLLDLLMYTLKGRNSEIRHRERFFKKLGIRFDPKWKTLIKEHSELFELSAFCGRLVIARLYMELDIWSDDWVPMKVNMETADKDLLIYCVEERHDERLLPLYSILTSKFKVFQSHSLECCWKVEFDRCTKMEQIGYHLIDNDVHFKDTEYRVNTDDPRFGFQWHLDWRNDAVIDRIECRNTKLFGNQVVWTQIFDSSMDTDPKEFVVSKDNDKRSPTYNSNSMRRHPTTRAVEQPMFTRLQTLR